MERTFTSPLVDVAHFGVALLWLGLLLGVCFIATPVKFSAGSLSLPVALDVGRVTFALFNTIEWGAFTLLVVVVVFSGPRPFAAVATVLLGSILILQSVWLLPVLDDRVTIIIEGGVPEGAPWHLVYIAADVAKAALLAAMGWSQATSLARAISKNTLR